ETADVVDHREVRDVVEEPVDREVAPERVLAGSSERVVGGLEELGGLALARLGPTPEGRYFDDLPVGEQDVRQPEAAPDQPAIAEKLPQRLGMGVGSDVEILGHPPEHQV